MLQEKISNEKIHDEGEEYVPMKTDIALFRRCENNEKGLHLQAGYLIRRLQTMDVQNRKHENLASTTCSLLLV